MVVLVVMITVTDAGGGCDNCDKMVVGVVMITVTDGRGGCDSCDSWSWGF